MPEKISSTMTNRLIRCSSSLRAARIPSQSPASITGESSSARRRIAGVRMPQQAYRMMRRVFSSQKTMQRLALNS